MKLSEIKPNVETSGDLEEQFFSIQDTGMIFDILRNKMYSNPILAICREISCNARDAHREVGKQDVPIHIYLPNNLEPFYKIKDFGPGISPDRMSNIFIKYTASTKRNDNLQTGGFGLGAKTPFSYSDTFTIVTNYNGKKYNYACFIDETKVGKLALLAEAPTDEPNGTEIIIQVKSEDFNKFITSTERSTRHWATKPIIKGAQLSWETFKPALFGKNWEISAQEVSYLESKIKLIIDEIEYPLDVNALKSKTLSSKIISAFKGTLLLHFGVGELSLSASREQVYLDDPTQLLISTRLEEIAQEVKRDVLDNIEKIPNYWNANVYFKKEIPILFRNPEFLGTLTWRGLPLYNHSVGLSTPVFYFSKDKMSDGRIRRSNAQSITFYDDSLLVFNDLNIKEPTLRHVKKAFDENPNITRLQVICPSDKMTRLDLITHYHIDKMDLKNLSDYTKAPRVYKASSSRLLVFKYDKSSGSFGQVPYSYIKDDTNNKALCFLSKGHIPSSRMPFFLNGKNVSLQSLSVLIDHFPNLSIYGVDSSTPKDRIKEDLDGFTLLEDFLQQEIVNSKKIDFLKIKIACGNTGYINSHILEEYNTYISDIESKTSPYLKRVLATKETHDEYYTRSGLLYLYESLAGDIDKSKINDYLKLHPETDLKTLASICDKKYPLLLHLNHYGHCSPNHIIEYINLIDKI